MAGSNLPPHPPRPRRDKAGIPPHRDTAGVSLVQHVAEDTLKLEHAIRSAIARKAINRAVIVGGDRLVYHSLLAQRSVTWVAAGYGRMGRSGCGCDWVHAETPTQSRHKPVRCGDGYRSRPRRALDSPAAPRSAARPNGQCWSSAAARRDVRRTGVGTIRLARESRRTERLSRWTGS